MATVRITGTTPRNVHVKEWLGAPAIDDAGRIDRTVDLPEIIYQRMEASIAGGAVEGTVRLDDGWRIDWFLDRRRPESESGQRAGTVDRGEGI